MDWVAYIGNEWMRTALWAGSFAVVFAILTKLMPCNPAMVWGSDLRAVVTDFMYWFVLPFGIRLGRWAMLAAGMRLFFGGHDPEFLPVKDWPVWQQCALMLVIQDVLLYPIHRLFHLRWAWKVHAIHHAPKMVDWTATARFHPINNLLEFALADVVVILLGFSSPAIQALFIFNQIYSCMVHANLNWTFGPLRYVLASPVFHRWHHTTEGVALNKNFASTFPILDVIFGTFYMPRGRLPEKFGVSESDVPEGFWAQLAYPFRKTEPRQATLVEHHRIVHEPEFRRQEPTTRGQGTVRKNRKARSRNR
jgi:sterol desaturase/sphingolipid hydroxylase (fatty acid hydroxylase superfamily)